jgi:cobalamin-dependent methionine synthase I
VVTHVGQDQLHLARNKSLQSALLSSVLSDAKEIATIVCTIGPRLEEETQKHLVNNEILHALLLDGIGSTAVETLGQEACKRVSNEASSRGLQASSPLAPGMPHFSIQEQGQLLQLAQAESISVSLTPSGLMIPEKSISMVIGLGKQMPKWTQADACAHCNLRDSCHYRIHT